MSSVPVDLTNDGATGSDGYSVNGQITEDDHIADRMPWTNYRRTLDETYERTLLAIDRKIGCLRMYQFCVNALWSHPVRLVSKRCAEFLRSTSRQEENQFKAIAALQTQEDVVANTGIENRPDAIHPNFPCESINVRSMSIQCLRSIRPGHAGSAI